MPAKLYNHKYDHAARLNESKGVHALGMVDEKGRAVGLYVATYEYDTVEDTECTFEPRSPIAPGRIYAVYMQATRNGRTFGAVQNSEWFATEADRAAAIAKRIAETTKRYAKKYADK